jgi:predicted flap endonuclease-1-like 5' DNA nuclease
MGRQRGLPWWTWVPFLPVLLSMLLIWRFRLLHRSRVDVHRDSIPLPPDSPYRPAPQADDLVEIKGIGLKSAAALNKAGIYTFDQLAQTPVDELREITHAAGLRLVDPTSWPEQAAGLTR